VPALKAVLYGLLSKGALGVRWRGKILATKIGSSEVSPFKVDASFQVPAALCAPGIVEWEMGVT